MDLWQILMILGSAMIVFSGIFDTVLLQPSKRIEKLLGWLNHIGIVVFLIGTVLIFSM